MTGDDLPLALAAPLELLRRITADPRLLGPRDYLEFARALTAEALQMVQPTEGLSAAEAELLAALAAFDRSGPAEQAGAIAAITRFGEVLCEADPSDHAYRLGAAW